MDPIIFLSRHDCFVGAQLTEEQERDARNAVAHARVTGSVGCTYNEATAKRLYVVEAGDRVATDLWQITVPTTTDEEE